jgi:hypothetical protein
MLVIALALAPLMIAFGSCNPPAKKITVKKFSTSSDNINLFLGTHVETIPMPEITQAVIDSGTVLVYRGRNNNDTSEWLAMPFTEPVDLNQQRVLSYYYGLREGELRLYFQTHFQITQWPVLGTFIYQWNVIIIE